MKPLDKAIERPKVSTGLRIARFVAKAVLPLVVIAAGIMGYQHLRATKPVLETAPAVERVWTVEAMTVALETVTPTIIAYGTLQAGRDVSLRPLVAGEVIELGENFKTGARIAQGDLLIAIDPFDYDSTVSEARANLAEAEARVVESDARIALEESSLENARNQLDLAERDLARAEELQSRGALSDRTLEERQLIVEQRRQQIIQGENAIRIEQAGRDQRQAVANRLRVAVTRAERDLANTRLVAPFDGIVSETSAEMGRMVATGDAVATVLASEDAEVRFTLTEVEYARLVASGEPLVGRAVEVIWSAGQEELRFDAEIVRVAPEIDASRGGVELIAVLDSEPSTLRSGAFVEIELADRSYQNVVSLPQTALYGSDTVYTIVDDRLQARLVDVIGPDGDQILVSGPLTDGDRILTSRITEIGEGLAVETLDRR